MTPTPSARSRLGLLKASRAGFACILLSLLVVAGCAGATASGDATTAATADGVTDTAAADGDGPLIVATTAVMGDLATTVAGDGASVTVLMDAGADPHTFALSAQQRGILGDADLVVANGLDLEAGFGSVLDDVAGEGVPVVEIAAALDPVESDEDHADEDHADEDHADEDHADEDHADEDHGHDHDGPDPHVWLDPVRMAGAGDVLADVLAGIADGPWQEGADQWRARMEDADVRVSAALEPIADGCRLLVTEHDALGYFAARYDFEVVGTIIPSLSTDAEPSASDLAELSDTIEETGATAIFVEDTASTRQADALAAEFDGAVVVQPVPVASVGSPDLPGLDDLQVELATRIATALAPCTA